MYTSEYVCTCDVHIYAHVNTFAHRNVNMVTFKFYPSKIYTYRLKPIPKQVYHTLCVWLNEHI